MDPLPPGPEYHALTGMCGDFCNALQIDLLFPELIGGGVIDWKEKDKICCENLTEPKRVQALLNIIIKDASVNDCGKFHRFRNVLRRSPNCSFLLERLDDCLKECRQSQISSIRELIVTLPRID